MGLDTNGIPCDHQEHVLGIDLMVNKTKTHVCGDIKIVDSNDGASHSVDSSELRFRLAIEIPYTPRAKHVLQTLLLDVSGHNYIGSEDLLLGWLRESEGVATRVLENLGADPNNIPTQAHYLHHLFFLLLISKTITDSHKRVLDLIS
ncbi:ATP-dependent Clp protease ATP-binding subunit clpA, chloroplastic [Artemisia annua]|uniref:ATP-dependent Clp protease ATP-binding subunit clpA, chloroplastic n=1 Tax=Artemisia annua TaxID=35608 RepID=A0A2U1PFW6_ARTAN|nr:ATP-dependent Clp protease ATP-binding subunit clpA, chloroplastic [Artemisia annua]